MEDVTDYFKSGFLSLHKNTVGKNYQQKTLKDRMTNFNNLRRETRSTLIYQKRQISDNITPINTPETSRIVKNTMQKNEGKKSNKRLEMLNKWKAEKEKRKQEEKNKAKPLFKVCHVPVEVGLPNLDRVNREIKGKLISSFAPPNHTFHAPKNIKPINFNFTNINNVSSNNKSKFTRKNSVTDQNVSELNSKTSSRVVTRSRDVSKKQGSVISQKPINKPNADKSKPAKNTPMMRTNVESKSNQQKTRQAVNSVQKNTSLRKADMKKETVSSKTNINTKAKCFPAKSKINEKIGKETNSEKPVINVVEKKSNNKTGTPAKIPRTPKKNKIQFDDGNSIVNENKKLRSIEKREKTVELAQKAGNSLKDSRKKIVRTPKKNVGWNIIEIVDSDDEVLSKDIDKRTPKTNKRYNKTPRKGEKAVSIDDVEDIVKTDVEPKSPATPKNNKIPDSESALPVYVSPFVTVSRGKTSARKEYQVRRSTGSAPDTPDFPKNIASNISPKAGAEYFSVKLDKEISRLESICQEWNTFREENDISEEANDMIDVAIGQSNLLISKKFKQFRSLIEQCKSNDFTERPITCEDLHGFWDMTYMQVEDLNKRFKNLDDLKANNWKAIIPESKPVVKRGRGRPKKINSTSSLKNIIMEARKKKKTEDTCNQLLAPQTEDAKIFTGGYYSIKSPVKERNTVGISPATPSSIKRRSLRVSILAHRAKNRLSSPGLTMMKISQAIKHGDGLTPSKSILKTDLTKSATRNTKSVLFKDDLEEVEENLDTLEAVSLAILEGNKENDLNEGNLICFSPRTPTRRSKRLNKVN